MLRSKDAGVNKKDVKKTEEFERRLVVGRRQGTWSRQAPKALPWAREIARMGP